VAQGEQTGVTQYEIEAHAKDTEDQNLGKHAEKIGRQKWG
jgi:hypothetical protein